jgi:small subunit ribosomal protein S19e
VLRKLYIKNTIGVSRLRAEYGGGKNRGSAPVQARSGSGSIVRKILQELEGVGLVEKKESEGRKLTSKGVSLLDRVAHKVRSSVQKEAIPELRKY